MIQDERKKKPIWRPIEWSGRPIVLDGDFSSPSGWIIEARWRVGHGDRGYDNCVQRKISRYEYEAFPGILEYVLVEMEDMVKEAAYAAICNDRLMFDLDMNRHMMAALEQRTYEAEKRAEAVEQQAAKAWAILKALARE